MCAPPVSVLHQREVSRAAPAGRRRAMRGEWGHLSVADSPYTRYLELHPLRSRTAVVVAALGMLLLARRLGR